jgi:hypothetical protein
VNRICCSTTPKRPSRARTLLSAAAFALQIAADSAKDDRLKAIEPSLLELGPLVPAPSTEPDKSGGLSVHFSPYAVGSYAEGLYTVVVPWRGFERFLSPEGRAVFGGEPLPPKTKE